MFSLNRVTLIGNMGADAKVVPNGPTTISRATNVTWKDKETRERHNRTEWHQLVLWNGLAAYAAKLPKGTPLYVEGELIYEKYQRKVDATIGKKTTEVEVLTTNTKIRVDRLIRLESAADAPDQTNDDPENYG
jgi:single-strand DNA-binding protein